MVCPACGEEIRSEALIETYGKSLLLVLLSVTLRACLPSIATSVLFCTFTMPCPCPRQPSVPPSSKENVGVLLFTIAVEFAGDVGCAMTLVGTGGGCRPSTIICWYWV